jgi:hypothetical protein
MEPASPITHQHKLLCGSMPQFCRNHVYVFFILGIDPLDCADVGGLRGHLQGLGFIKSYLGDWFCKDHFAKCIHKIREEDKLARFALVGYRLGACSARDLAEKLKGENIPIDLLVYLGEGAEGARPANVQKLLNIQGTSCLDRFFTPPHIEGAENFLFAEESPKGTVCHPKTLDRLVYELTVVASRIPVVEKPTPPNPFPEPTPHPLVPVPPGPRDEWDFLKPQPLVPPGQTPQQPEPRIETQPEVLPQPKDPSPQPPAG